MKRDIIVHGSPVYGDTVLFPHQVAELVGSQRTIFIRMFYQTMEIKEAKAHFTFILFIRFPISYSSHNTPFIYAYSLANDAVHPLLLLQRIVYILFDR